MLRYHVAFYLPHKPSQMVVAEALDFPGAASQGFDLPDARLMIESALEDLAPLALEQGKPLPVPDPNASALMQIWSNMCRPQCTRVVPAREKARTDRSFTEHGCLVEREGARHTTYSNPSQQCNGACASSQ